MRFPKLAILLLNYNGKRDTLECLAALQAANQKPKFATIVIDNGSTDGSVDAIRTAFPEVPIFQTKENLGFAGGNNVGIRWALTKSFDWIFLLNNDTVIAPDCMGHLLAAAKKKPDGKIFGAKIYRYHDKERLDHFGGFWNPNIAEFESIGQNRIDDGTFQEMHQVDYVSGCALLMHRSVPEAIGLLEENFFLLWEESDFCSKARSHGFQIWTVPEAKIWHKVSASFTGGKPHMHYFWWRNRLLYIARNFSKTEKRKLYRTILIPEMAKCFKLALLKSTQQGLLTLLGRGDGARREKARRYRAGCLGILHYFLGRFGNCPSHLFKKLTK